MSFAVWNEPRRLVEVSTDGYSVEADSLDKHRWHDIVQEFDDANLMQTWSYGAARWGQDKLSHVCLLYTSRCV